jgi:hypothetical protein
VISRQGSGAEVDALQRVLAAEHAAVYGYGLVGGRLAGLDQAAATASFVAHESRRDAVSRLLRDRGAVPVAALPAYRPATPVVGRVSALRLAMLLEEGCAASSTNTLAVTDDATLRRSAAGWLGDAAARDQDARRRAGAAALAATPPLPGLLPPTPQPTPP